MRKPSVLIRAREALRVFRWGYPGPSEKALPFSWAPRLAGKPLWHITDLAAYVNQGFNANSLIYSAVMYKVRAMITAPLRAYTGDPDYPKQLPPEHSLSRLVERPNEHQSWSEFHSQNVVFLNVAGNVYILKVVEGRKKMLYSLRPDRVYIIPSEEAQPAGLKGFLYVPEGKSVLAGVPILPKDMIHIKLPNPWDPLEGMGYGLSPISPCARNTDVDNTITKYLQLFFDRGTMLTALLKFQSSLSDTIVDNIKARWSEMYGGWEQWGVGVLDRGGEYERLGMTFEEMGFQGLDSRNETRILGPFGVPPILIGSRYGLERSTYSNYAEARKMVWEDTLVPELKLFEVEYQQNLKGRDAFVQFDLSRVPALQKDVPGLVEAAYKLWSMGVPANQALRGVGLSIGSVPGGDTPHVPVNFAPVGGPSDEEEPEGEVPAATEGERGDGTPPVRDEQA